MPRSYIPAQDSEYETWATNFSSYITTHFADLPIEQADITEVSDTVGLYRTNLNIHTTAKDASQAARQIKDERKSISQDVIRRVVRQLQASPVVSDAQREAMGRPVRDRTRTYESSLEMGRPVVSIDTSEYLVHKLRYWPEAAAGKAGSGHRMRGVDEDKCAGRACADKSRRV